MADKNYHQFSEGCSLQSYLPSLYLIRTSRSELDSMFLYNHLSLSECVRA